MNGPDHPSVYPMPGFPQVVFLRNVITRPNIEIGDYSYYDDPDGAERFETRNTRLIRSAPIAVLDHMVAHNGA